MQKEQVENEFLYFLTAIGTLIVGTFVAWNYGGAWCGLWTAIFSFFAILFVAIYALFSEKTISDIIGREEEVPVTPVDQAITQVSATSLSIFGFISFVLYKLFSKKKVENKEVAKETSVESEVKELINSIE